jgi:hypothetical protein
MSGCLHYFLFLFRALFRISIFDIRVWDGAESRSPHWEPPNKAPGNVKTEWLLRLAREDDVTAIEALIPLSVRGLQSSHYSAAQMEAAIGSVFGVDRQLIRDGTYFVVERPPSVAAATSSAAGDNELIGCGGWSKRKTFSVATTKQTAMMRNLIPRMMRRAFARSLCIHIGRAMEWVAPFSRSAKKRFARRDLKQSNWRPHCRVNRSTPPLVTLPGNDRMLRWRMD